ncbi:MAG: acylphosphatase [Candidatus Eisenbacteria bacterium]
MEAARAHIVVSGMVQGVGYRFFALRQGRALGLKGFVRNVPDGTVELEVEGERESIESLLSALREGPRAARVSQVSVSWREFGGELGDFEVGF